jgi:hypothetical protein
MCQRTRRVPFMSLGRPRGRPRRLCSRPDTPLRSVARAETEWGEERARPSDRLGSETSQLPWLPAAKSATEQRVKFVPIKAISALA